MVDIRKVIEGPEQSEYKHDVDCEENKSPWNRNATIGYGPMLGAFCQTESR